MKPFSVKRFSLLLFQLFGIDVLRLRVFASALQHDSLSKNLRLICSRYSEDTTVRKAVAEDGLSFCCPRPCGNYVVSIALAFVQVQPGSVLRRS